MLRNLTKVFDILILKTKQEILIMNTETNTAETTVDSRLEKFHFKAVKVDNDPLSKSSKAIAMFKESGVAYEVAEKDKMGQAISVIRTPVAFELPVLSLSDLSEAYPKFVGDILHKLVVTTARKMYIDKCCDVEEITYDDVIRENSVSSRVSISTEDLAAFSAFNRNVMTERKIKAGTVETILALVNGKFSTGTLNKYISNADKYEGILAAICKYVAEYAKEEEQELFTPICEILVDNLTKWEEVRSTVDEDIDTTAL